MNSEDRKTSSPTLFRNSDTHVWKMFDPKYGTLMACKARRTVFNEDLLRELYVSTLLSQRLPITRSIHPKWDCRHQQITMTMPLALGTLDQVLFDIGPPALIPSMFRPVLQQLHQFHSWGIVHLDVKPGNVLVFAKQHGQYHVRLSDFEHTRAQRSFHSTGAFVVTSAWRPPEVESLKRDSPLLPSIDMFGVGVILWEWLMIWFQNMIPDFPFFSLNRRKQMQDYWQSIAVYAGATLADWHSLSSSWEVEKGDEHVPLDSYKPLIPLDVAQVPDFAEPCDEKAWTACRENPLVRWLQKMLGLKVIPVERIQEPGFMKLLLLSFWCMHWNPHKRPSAAQCLKFLELEVQPSRQTPDPIACLFDPADDKEKKVRFMLPRSLLQSSAWLTYEKYCPNLRIAAEQLYEQVIPHAFLKPKVKLGAAMVLMAAWVMECSDLLNKLIKDVLKSFHISAALLLYGIFCLLEGQVKKKYLVN